jgi:acyl-CoA thioester hydrolase
MSGHQAEGRVRLRVRYAETDQMGVVYHANYLPWCELGRTELMRDLGHAYADLEKAGVKLAVAEAALRYGRAARYDDPILVVTRLVGAQSRSVTFAYDIFREDPAGPTLLCTATTKLVAIDDRGATCRLPPDLLERFREIATPR